MNVVADFAKLFINLENHPLFMSRSLLSAFDDDFIREIKSARNYPEAFDKATEKFESSHGFKAFDNYDQFRRKKKRLHKK